MESLGTAARRLLAGLERDAARKADKASRGLQKPGEFEPEASREEEAQTSGIRAGGNVRGLERMGGPQDLGSAGFCAALENGDACGPDVESLAVTDRAECSTLHVLEFRRSGRRVPRAAGGPAVILDFAGPLRSPALEW